MNTVTTAIAVAALAAAPAAAVTVLNPSFEDTSAWAVSNDAELAFPGGAAGFIWDTPVVDDFFVESSEDVFPTEGNAFAIT